MIRPVLVTGANSGIGLESALYTAALGFRVLGVGPVILRDLTRVDEVEEGRRLVLAARMMPFAVNRVGFTLHSTAGATQVDVEERPVDGPMAALWNPVLDALMWLRNQEMLRRLRRLAERRAARR